MKNVSAKKIVSMAMIGATAFAVGACAPKVQTSLTDPTSSTTNTPVMASSVNTVGQKIQGAAFLTQAQGLALGKPVKPTFLEQFFGINTAEADPFNGIWDQAGSVLGLNWQQVSIKEYLGEALNSHFVNPNGANVTAFGRFNSSVGQLCALGIALAEQGVTGIPADGQYPFTIDIGPGTKVSSQCEGFSNSPAMSLTGTLSVSTPSDTSVYMKKLELLNAGMNPGFMYLTYSDQWIRIASIEHNDQFLESNRTIAEYDRVNNIVRFEYLSQSFQQGSAAEFHRIYMDGTNNVGYIISHTGGTDSNGHSQYLHFAASGTPSDATRQTVAISVGIKGQQSGLADSEGLDACVNASNGAITNDGSLVCQTTGFEVSTATAIAPSISKHAQESDITLTPTMQIPFQNVGELLVNESF